MKLTNWLRGAAFAAVAIVAGACLMGPGDDADTSAPLPAEPGRNSWHLVVEVYDPQGEPINARVGVILDVVDNQGNTGGEPGPDDPHPPGQPRKYPYDGVVLTPWVQTLYAEPGIALNINGEFTYNGPTTSCVEVFIANAATYEEIPGTRVEDCVLPLAPHQANGTAQVIFTRTIGG